MLDTLEITAEERELLKEFPVYLERIDRGDPLIKAWLAAWRAKRTVATYERPSSEREFVENNECGGKLLCQFPTDLTRCSPFFPMSRQSLNARTYLQDVLVAQGSWGEILFSGPKLSIFDEDVLMTILSVMLQKNTLGESRFENKYFYEGPILHFLKVIYKSTPSKYEYRRFKDSLTRLSTSALELAISYGDGTRKRNRSIHNMISSVIIDEKTNFIKIVINPYFYEMYVEGNTTYIDMKKRIEIDTFIGKALYRFLLSQYNASYKIHFLKLANALNMNLKTEKKRIRETLKKAINELIKKSILDSKSCFLTKDIVFLIKK